MPKKHRLSGRDLRSTRAAKRLNGAFFSLAILPLPGTARKTAVVVGKSVAVRAVDRNLLKRHTREILRRELPRVPAGRGFVLTARKSAVQASMADLEADIRQLFGKV